MKKTHAQFVFEANKKHNNKYCYPESYKGDSIKIEIKCPIHGIFKQIPGSHLRGHGCSKCAREYSRKLFAKDFDNFIIEANSVHNNIYEYVGTYTNAKSKIEIKCYIHGIFKQTPDKHLRGNGCPKCAGTERKTKEEFVNQALLIHNAKYTYPGEYINARTNIEIECKKHGIFLQVPNVHLNGSGCPTCSSNSSKPEMQWLDSLGIPNDNKHRHCKIYIGKSYIKPDGFDPNTNTIYEFYGDYFHGNPLVYNADVINHKNKKTCGELYKKTLERAISIKDAGYNLVFIWESDWKNKEK